MRDADRRREVFIDPGYLQLSDLLDSGCAICILKPYNVEDVFEGRGGSRLPFFAQLADDRSLRLSDRGRECGGTHEPPRATHRELCERQTEPPKEAALSLAKDTCLQCRSRTYMNAVVLHRSTISTLGASHMGLALMIRLTLLSEETPLARERLFDRPRRHPARLWARGPADDEVPLLLSQTLAANCSVSLI